MRCGVLWACATLLWSSSTAAVPSPSDLAAYKNAGARLISLIASAQERREIAQLKTPEATRLLKAVTDEERILGAGSYAADELGTILDICDVANKVAVSLMLFDLWARVDPKKSEREIQASVVSIMNSNIVEFQDELKELQPFQLRCLAKEVAPMTEFVSSLKPVEFTEVRRQGLVGVRSGLLQIYSGALQAANDARYRDDYRVALLAALAETSAHLVPMMELPVRKDLRETARTAAVKATGAYRTHLTHITKTLSEETCDGLCAIR